MGLEVADHDVAPRLGMAAASARPTACSRRDTPRPSGRDVVIGYLEPHGRAETAAQADGLEVVPRRRVTYRDTPLEEMDLPAILRRAPELCLIDELAHTNAPGRRAREALRGRRGRARRRDRRLLDRQRPAPREPQRPGRRADRHRGSARRSPTRVLGEADEVVLIDLTPEALIERLRAGKVYPRRAHRGGAQQLLQDREPRRAARGRAAPGRRGGRVQAARRARRGRHARGPAVERAAPQAVGERLLALVKPHAERRSALVRRAWRSAQRLGRELDVLWVQPPGAADRARGGASSSTRCGGSPRVLGANLLVERGRRRRRRPSRGSPRERGTTYILMGDAEPRGALARGCASRCRSG